MKYIVWFNDESYGYGCYVHLIGIFDTMELANEAIKKVNAKIESDIQKNTDARFFEIGLVGVDVNEISYPKFNDWKYESKYILGGYAE